MKLVMVHGIWDRGSVYRRMDHFLTERGHQCFRPDLIPANGAHGLRDLAEKLKQYIDTHIAAEESIGLIGFSMGSLVAREYLQHLGGATRSSHFFTLSGPHQGTLMAHLWMGKAARDMRFRSKFLQKLNHDIRSLEHMEVHSYRTPFDLLIMPSKSSHLKWANNHTVTALFHHRMLTQEKIFAHIADVLQHTEARGSTGVRI